MSVRVSTAGPVAPARRHRLDEVLRVGALVRRAAAPTSASVGPAAWIDGQLVRLPGHPPASPSSSDGPQLYSIAGRLYVWNPDFEWYERYERYPEPLPPPPPPMRQPADRYPAEPYYEYTTPPRDSPELPYDEVPPPPPGRTSPARDLSGGNERGRRLFFSEVDDGEDNNNNYNNDNEDNNEDEMSDAMRRMDID